MDVEVPKSERTSDMPYTLQRDINRHREVPNRHLKKEADSASLIAMGPYHTSRTPQDIDSVESGLPDFIQTLKPRFQELQNSRAEQLG